MDYSPPSSSVHGTSQAGVLGWVAISFCRFCPSPGLEPAPPALAGGFLTTEAACAARVRIHISILFRILFPYRLLQNI